MAVSNQNSGENVAKSKVQFLDIMMKRIVDITQIGGNHSPARTLNQNFNVWISGNQGREHFKFSEFLRTFERNLYLSIIKMKYVYHF